MKNKSLNSRQKIASISIIAVLTAIIIIIYGYFLISRVYGVSDAWVEYNREAASLSYTLSQLYENVGYGGFIHNFKNYVLRGDSSLEVLIEKNLIDTKNTLEKLRNNPLLIATHDHNILKIKHVFNIYSEKYLLAQKMMVQKYSPIEIDKIVKVDDRAALEALHELSLFIIEFRQVKELNTQKQIEMTFVYVMYGGLILPLIILVCGFMIYQIRSLSISNMRLISTQRFLDDIIKASPEAIIISNNNKDIIKVNRRTCNLFAYTEEELLGKSIKDLIPEKLHEIHNSHIQQHFESPRNRLISEVGALVAMTKDKKRFPSEISLSYSEHDGTKVSIAVIRDISERIIRARRVQSLLDFERIVSEITATFVNIPIEKVPERISQMLKKVAVFLAMDSAIIYRYDKPEKCLSLSYEYHSPALKNNLETDSDLILPWLSNILKKGELINLFDVVQLEKEAPLDYQFYKKRQLHSILVIPARLSDDSICALELSTTKDYHWNNELISRVKLLSDIFASAITRILTREAIRIAEQKASESREHLIHIARLHTMGELASGIAHEINQPLAAIVGYTEACIRRINGNNAPLPKLYEILEKISNQAKRAGEVISRLRKMVKKEDTNYTEIDMNKLIKESISLIQYEAHINNISIVCELSQSIPHTYIDNIQIQQVILNLTRNSIEAIGENQSEKRMIRIESKVYKEDNVEVIISDTGPGISYIDTIEGVFEPFFSHKSSGLGVGLSICKRIIEVHSGQIWAENLTGDDLGAAFHFTLPGIKNE